MRSLIALAALCVAALLGAAAAGQQTQPLPGPGTGIVPVTVKGTVDIGNTPMVTAVQQGDWKVAVEKTADVRIVDIAPPEFIRKGGSYSITWAGGDQEKIVVTQVSVNGWIRTERDGRARWINLANVRAIEEAR